MTSRIPQPPAIPFLGNVTSIDKELPIRSFQLLAQQYGEIYQLNVLGRTTLFCNSYQLVNELSDEVKFKKEVGAALMQVRNLVGDGLFTAHNEEHNWAIAHRLLMPAFGTAAIRNMLEEMRDISDQLILKWERFGPTHLIDCADDYTRVALDTVAYCSMSYRLNSFYTESQPAFAQSMFDFLKECFARTNRPSIMQALMPSLTQNYEDDIKFMNGLAHQIVADRRANPIEKNDLLNKMLNGKDPKSGEGLTDDNITKNLLTFLIAGHETSSGTLAFATYYLLKNPEMMRKLREEVDSVIGDRPAQYGDLSNMPYLAAVIRETLRLQPPAPIRSVTPIEDTVIAEGKYAVKKGAHLAVVNYVAQKDPKVFGDDANEFRPERMLDGKFEALPPNSWQPFGFGMRACIGRAFAWQEIQLILASIVQKFDLSLADPSYTLELKQALTIKPKDFHIRAVVRKDRQGRSPSRLYAAPSNSLVQTRVGESKNGITGSTPKSEVGATQPLYVLYGSNSGTSEAFAQRIASEAPSYGFKSKLGTLDSAAGNLPTDGPIIIVTASFEGEPADNATKFVDWLRNLKSDELSNVRYAVFGCGNHDWVQTYQKIPRFCDSTIEERGGKRIYKRGEGDAGQGNFFQMFDEFVEGLWKTLTEEYKTKHVEVVTSFEVETVDTGSSRATTLRQPDAGFGKVIENRILTKPGAPVKRHIDFELPIGASARAGDYLAILPHNPPRDVRRVLAYFGLPETQEVVINTSSPTTLPVGKPLALSTLLSGYVEISQPATPKDLRTLIAAAPSSKTKKTLEDLLSFYTEKVLAKRLSILDILQAHADLKLSLSAYLQMVPPMRVRQYSISSSPLWNATRVTLTISVVEAPSISGSEEPFLGVASNYLASLRPGDRVQMAVRPSSVNFHPPSDPMTPVVMFCAGSGLAPMRGFIQERAEQKKAGREVGKMLLFFGCRSPGEDFLYGETDLKEWMELGVVDVRPAFSRDTEKSMGCKYVQDRVWHDKDEITKAYEAGAKFFTCGSSKVASGVKDKIVEHIKLSQNCDSSDAAAKFEKVFSGRYATDIFD